MEVKFKIVGTGYEEMPNNFNPNKGTVKSNWEMPSLWLNIDSSTLRKLFINGKSGQRLIAVVLIKKEQRQKISDYK